MALAAWPKDRNAPAPDLDGLPDDLPDRALAFLARAGISVYAWQEPILRDLIATDRPRVAYVQTPRKNGKTRLAARPFPPTSATPAYDSRRPASRSPKPTRTAPPRSTWPWPPSWPTTGPAGRGTVGRWKSSG